MGEIRIMGYRGRVHNGMVVLEEPCPWPEGTEVNVVPRTIEQPKSARQKGAEEAVDDGLPSLYERLKPVIGIVKNGPPDWARNHDHYIHGAPKKPEPD